MYFFIAGAWLTLSHALASVATTSWFGAKIRGRVLNAAETMSEPLEARHRDRD